jgi:ribose transport system ATP-binding protein
VGPGAVAVRETVPRETARPLLELRDVRKSFGGTHALAGANLLVRPGEVHGLLGQNGSGKSTLLRVLAGFHAPDGGELWVRGERVELPLEPGRFRELGLAFVHQDLALVLELSVTENLLVSRLAHGGRIRWRAERARAAAMLTRHGLEGIDVTAPVGRLTPMQRALLAIVRAIEELRADEHDAPLLVLDEPTAFLPDEGVARLFALVRELVAGGASVLLVTHDLDEVRGVCDRATVLRDGRDVGTVEVADSEDADLVELIIGHRLERRAPASRAVREDVALRVRGLGGAIIAGVDLELHAGEVLGVTGLVGSGFEEVPRVLFGAVRGRGRLTLDGRELDLAEMTPGAAMAAGLAFVPADRQAEASVGSLSVADNVTATTLPAYRPALLSRRRMRTATGELGARFGVRPNDPRLPFGALSGGNQQKAVLAKWLQGRPALLLLEEPTQGVDVGAREQIFEAIRAAAAGGAAVICASADYEELAAVCARVAIVARGRIVSELDGAELSKERIAEQVLTSVTVQEET